MTGRKQPSRLAKALLERADDMRRAVVTTAAVHEQITLRHLGEKAGAAPEELSREKIRAPRERAHLSQAILACYLNVAVGYISQLERGVTRPTGPVLVLLDVIRRKIH